MKKSTGVVVGMLTAGVVAGAVYAANNKNMKSTKKKVMKAINKTVKNAGCLLDDLSAMMR